MHRFFVPPSWVRGNRVTMTGPQAHQIARVLRMQVGDTVIILDNSGWEIETNLVSVDGQVVEGRVVRRRLNEAEPRTKVSLYQSVLKGRHFELILQKCTELGIVEFVPIIADRCVMSHLEDVEKKRIRWELIIQEAAEQSRRGRKPALRAATLLAQACERVRRPGGLSLIPWEEEHHTSIGAALSAAASATGQGTAPFAINLFVGPEGGFTLEEISLARHFGLIPVTMGPRILRADTAGLVASAVILHQLGDLQFGIP